MRVIVILILITVFISCTMSKSEDFSQYNFSTKNTLAIFLLKNERGWFFCIPIQYLGNYKIDNFKFDTGNIKIGDYDILLKKDELNISIYLNENVDENGNTQYDIFIEKYLTDNEMENIINEYKNGNVYSQVSVWYDITIDNEEQNGNGMLDDFELFSGEVQEYTHLFPHFEFFRTKYLEK
jgi:hypothetical protein